jgi:hypothetical protein
MTLVEWSRGEKKKAEIDFPRRWQKRKKKEGERRREKERERRLIHNIKGCVLLSDSSVISLPGESCFSSLTSSHSTVVAPRCYARPLGERGGEGRKVFGASANARLS